MAAVVGLAPGSGLTTAVCAALEVSRASVHRRRTALTAPPCVAKQRHPVERALPESERDHVLAHLRTPRFADQTPAEVYATLLDKGVYLCSIRTMYRILAAHGEVAHGGGEAISAQFPEDARMAVETALSRVFAATLPDLRSRYEAEG